MIQLGRRGFLSAAGAAIASRAWAEGGDGLVRVEFQTGQGTIKFALEAVKAPLTTANFLKYIDAGRYTGSTIYRAVKASANPLIGLLQGGAKFDPAHPIPPVAHESTSQTGLRHHDGTLSLARREPGSGTSDFFICVGEASYLDADPKASGDNLGFAAFGQVIEGMDLVRKMLDLPKTTLASAPDMPNQMLDPPVPITLARRLDSAPAGA